MKGPKPKLIDRLGFAGISEKAIRDYRVLLVTVLGLALVAAMAWMNIARLEDPLIEPPIIFVVVPYPGASAEDVERQVLQPIEEELFGLDGIDYVDARAYPNYARFVVRFVYGTPMDAMTETVRGKVLGKKRVLPALVEEPVVTRSKMATYTAHMVAAVHGNRKDGTLGAAAERLKDHLVALRGIATVTLRGEQKRAVRVTVDPVRLAAQKLTVEDVRRAIEAANVRVPGGEVRVGAQATVLSLEHEFDGASDVAKIPLRATPDGSAAHTLTLADVAEVRDDFRTAAERMIVDGEPAVGLEIRFRPGENAVEIGKSVHALLERERTSLPPATKIKVVHDQPEWVRTSLAALTESLVEGIGLVMLVITLGMGWRSATVVALVLPLAMCGAIVGLYLAGFALDQISIAGLIVALGLLVDDAVVVAESIEVMRQRGLSALRAAVLGTARVFWANNGTTAVACASFLPLFFLAGDSGQFVRGLPVAVVLALVTSLLVAQFLTPWLSTFLLRSPRGAAPIADSTPFDKKDDSLGEHGEKNPVLAAIKAAYGWSIPKVIAHPWAVLFAATAMLVGSCLLLPKVGIQFFPKADKPILFVAIHAPRGADDSVTTRKVREAMRLIGEDPAVLSTSAMVGAPYPTLFVGQPPHPSTKDFGHVLVNLKEPSTPDLVARLRHALSSIPGAKLTIEELYTGPPVPSAIELRIQGDDDAKLAKYAQDVKRLLRAVPGTLNVTDTMSDSLPLAKVVVDNERAVRLGVTPGEVGRSLRSMYGEDKITSFLRGDDTVDVVLESASDKPLDSALEVTLGKRGDVPLRAVADVVMNRTVAERHHRNTHHVVDVTADVAGNVLPANVLKQLRPSLEAMHFDPGYTYSFQGAQAETESGFKSLAIAGTVTMFLIFVLLVLMFGSLTRSFVVLAAVPYALIGAIPGLYLTHNPFGFMAFLGLIALIGVYVNHKIYFVDRLNELLSRGMDWRSAVVQAGTDRLRPVVLTALTAILGLLPLTLGGGTFWAAFGWVNVFGLLASIPLSLVFLPALLTVSTRTARYAASSAQADAGSTLRMPALTVVPDPAPAPSNVTYLRPGAPRAPGLVPTALPSSRGRAR